MDDDLRKVLKGLKCCSDVGGKHCYEGKCPYASMSDPCREQLAKDAMELLKKQWVEIENLRNLIHGMKQD